jgi:hypothetical protein
MYYAYIIETVDEPEHSYLRIEDDGVITETGSATIALAPRATTLLRPSRTAKRPAESHKSTPTHTPQRIRG